MSLETPKSELLLEIARCPIATRCLSGDRDSGCSKIVLSQNAETLADFQVPEPWSGHLHLAPLLFLSSNPSIGPTRFNQYPRMTWEDNAIVEYFDDRFGDGPLSSVRDGIYDALPGSERSRTWTRYWGGIRSRAAELLGKRPHEVRPGFDYCLTEIVRCKSVSEFGVGEARTNCVERYLEPTLGFAAASTIVVMGALARDLMAKWLGIDAALALHLPVDVGGRSRAVLFLPHPTGRESAKTVRGCLTASQLTELGEWIATGAAQS